uniref:Uncharacterized protein n=1 Tax=Vespula pensylvanica TaxID=30213 RepID=A0A834NCI1_VESPE|nr:hypothetical protein H0235_014871 [Vespula pensylvanica]
MRIFEHEERTLGRAIVSNVTFYTMRVSSSDTFIEFAVETFTKKNKNKCKHLPQGKRIPGERVSHTALPLVPKVRQEVNRKEVLRKSVKSRFHGEIRYRVSRDELGS